MYPLPQKQNQEAHMVLINVTGFIIQCKTLERFWRGQDHNNKPYISSVDVMKYVIPTPVMAETNL